MKKRSDKFRMISGFLTVIIAVCSAMSNIVTEAEVEPLLIRLSPSHDAYVPPSSLDPGGLLLVQSYSYSGTPMNRRTFIKFDLSSIPPGSIISYATLKLFMWDAPSESRKIECHRVTGGDWSESSITWENQPDATVLVTSVNTTITDNIWLSFDVTDSVKDFVWGNANNQGWRLKDAYESSPEFFSTGMYSKEHSDPSKRPYLEIKYYPPHLELELSRSIITAGEWVKMTVYRRTNYGNPITYGNLRVNLGSTSTSANKKFSLTQGGATITSLTILGGFDHMDFYYYDDKAGTWDIKVWTEDYAKYGDDTHQLKVTPAPPAMLVIMPSSFTMNAGETYSLNISLRDAYGFETTSTSDIIVRLSSTSPIGEFRQPGAITRMSSVTIPTGSITIKVDYCDLKGGTWVLTASATGLTSGTATVTVVPDTTPPVTTITYGPKYVSGATIYVSSVTLFELSANDDMCGVKETRYRIDGGPWNIYTAGFTLSNLADGSHNIDYYSLDRAGNNETRKTLTVILDKTPPKISNASPTGILIMGSGTITLTVRVEDNGSGVKEVRFTVDSSPWRTMASGDGNNYSKTITLSEGNHTWSVETVDNLNNTASWSGAFILTIDTTPPTISGLPSSLSPVSGESVTITCRVEDSGSGVKEVNLYYSTDGGSSWTKIPMSLQEGIYTCSIPPQTFFTKVWYYVEAVDNIGNRMMSKISEYTVAIPIWLYAVVLVLIITIIGVLLLRRRAHHIGLAHYPYSLRIVFITSLILLKSSVMLAVCM